jgi:hypothetical protein
MANELNIALSTGLTVTAQAYTAGAASGSAISLSEVGSSGFYTGNMTGSAGTYQLVFVSGGATVGTGQINWSGTAEIPFSTLTTADIPTAAISAIQAKTDNLPSDPADQSLLEAAIAGVTAPSASTVASAVRSELSVELARVDVAISTRSTPANIPTTDITAIKAKTDALNTTRLGQCTTTEILGNLLAQANS